MFDYDGTLAGFLAATLTRAALFIAAPAAAQDALGVISFGETDQGNDMAYGFAWNFPAKDAAHAEAVNACIWSGGTNCIQFARFLNGCGALAMDEHGNAKGKSGLTGEQAEVRALQGCEAAGGAGCNVVGSLCTTPDGVPTTYSGRESFLAAQDAQTTVTGPGDASLAREERVQLQQALTVLGFDAGPADGIFGPRTRAAILEWQNASGHEATGYVSREQAASLLAVNASPDREKEPRLEAADNQSGDVLIFGPATGPKCTEQGGASGGHCWRELANKSGCFFLDRPFDDYEYYEIRFNWSGACLNSTADGSGMLTESGNFDGDDSFLGVSWVAASKGEMIRGMKQGHWSYRGRGKYVDGVETDCSERRQFIGGKKNGRSVQRCSFKQNSQQWVEEREWDCVDGQCHPID